MEKKYDTLILSGGSMKGILFLGALEYLYEKGIIFDTFVGVSVGAIICYFLILGFKPFELYYIISTSKLWSYFSIPPTSNILRGSIFCFKPIRDELERITMLKTEKIPTMKDLPKNLIIITYNMSKEKMIEITTTSHPNLSCIDALQMSASLPFFFDKFWYDSENYIDGGLVNSFPIEIGLRESENIIGLVIVNNKDKPTSTPSLLSYLYKILFLPSNYTLENKIQKYSQHKIIQLHSDLFFFNINLDHRHRQLLFFQGYEKIANNFYSIYK